MQTFEKHFYIEHPAVKARSDADVKAYRDAKLVRATLTGCSQAYSPTTSKNGVAYPLRVG